MEQDALINTDVERRVLGCVFKDPTLLLEQDLDEWCFTRHEYKIIYTAMKALVKAKENVDLVTVEQTLRDAKKLNDADVSLMCLMDVFGAMPTGVGGKSYIKILKKLTMKRILRKYAQETIADLEGEDVDIEQIASKLQDNLTWLLCANDNNQNIVDVAGTMKKEVALLKERAVKKEAGLPTGYMDYDRIVGGLFKGDLNILAARPGMGKTALALNIARNVAYKQKKVVLYASLEMKAEELQLRLLASMAGVDASKFRTPSMITQEEWKRIDRASEWQAKDFYVMDKSDASPNEIKHRAKQIQLTSGLDLIVIDYLQLMSADYAKPSDRLAAVTEISRALKNMAQELDVPVIALSQLNRGVEARTDKRPMLSDLRDSGSIEQDADSALFLYRDKYYNPENGDDHTELIVSKNRHGARPTVNLYFKEATTEFVSLYKEGTR